MEVSLEPGLPIIFDPDGNLVFLAGPSKRSFRVCSRTVSRASPVFNRMLNGPWKESRPASTTDQDWTVELPEDDEVALEIVFHILHSQFDLIKHFLGIAELFQVCVIVNKYDLLDVLRPWASAWCAGIEANPTTTNDDRLLWIAWVLGHETMFTRTANEILLGATTVSDGSLEAEYVLVTRRSHIKSEAEYVNSIGILDLIAVTRLKFIESMLAELDGILRELQDSGDKKPRKCGFLNGTPFYDISLNEVLDCQCFMLGSFIRATRRQNLYPLPPPNAFTKSIDQLRSIVLSTQFEKMTNYQERQRRHRDCDLNKQISSIFGPGYKVVELHISPRFIDHLRNQRVRSGLPNE